MFRINLLPKEVLERRRYEGWYRWVFIIAIGLIAIILMVYVLLLLYVGAKNGDLQGIKEQSTQYANSAAKLQVFQDKENELAARQKVAQDALAGRINVGQVANDISLVLPDEVWLDVLSISEDQGVVLSANTPRTSGETVDVSYKSVAKTLVRLNELPQLYDVWLNSAANAEWSQWAVGASGDPTNALALKVVAFQASGKLVRPGASATATGAANSASAGTHTVAPANAAQNAVNANNAGSTSAAP
jgi:Tfp pilus assembly protein PilN